jgi:hypothetical protein
MDSPKQFLAFKDWLESSEHRRDDWIVVARLDKSDVQENRGTFSALLRNSDQDANTILGSFGWDIDTDLGHPFFMKSGGAGKITFELGTESSNDVTLEAFTISRYFHGAFESRIEIVQNFILYHELYYDSKTGKFINPITDDVVIDYVGPQHIRIRTTYLRDYLAARNMMLVRFHDHRRFLKNDVKEVLGKDSDELVVRTNDSHYRVYLGKLVDGETFSRLLGKDIVKPYEKPTRKDYLSLAGKLQRQFADFLVRIDRQGKRIESTCDENILDKSADRKAPHFLSPVYFRPEVFQKYRDNPRKYSVSAYTVSFLDQWEISIAVNKEGLVHAWLGDLGRIPYEEQLHWKGYNVPPSGGISEEFYRTQLLAEWVEPKDPVFLLHKVREDVNQRSQMKFGFGLFKDLRDEDAYVAKSILAPTSNEQKEFDDQLIYLSKYLVDALNKSELEARVSWRPKTKDENTHTAFLGAFLIERLGCSPEFSKRAIDALRTLQSLRSRSAAHMKSDEYHELLAKLGMTDSTPKQQFLRLIGLLNSALVGIKDAMV